MKNTNIELTILKALGIIAVVSCHIGFNIFNILGIPLSKTVELFPEYSYHMPLFIFASGYFYKRIYECNLLHLIKKRFSSLIKYTKCNLFYFILCFILINTGILSRKVNFNIHSLFIEPFLGGFQFYFNGPGWFVPFLFILQVSFSGLRKALRFKNESSNLKHESLFLIALTVIGVVSTSTANTYPVLNDNVNIMHSILRVLFGLQFFQLGFFYKEFIEKNFKLTTISFLLVLALKTIIHIIFGPYTFSLRTNLFNGLTLLPTITSILGILYCLHLTKFIISFSSHHAPKIINTLCIIGNNTWSIMMHHLLVKWCLLKIYNLSIIPDTLTTVGTYLISPILCILLPVLFANFYENKFKKGDRA